MKSNKAVFHWSGGKDSSIALHELLKGNDFQISTLLTSISEHHDRVSMHGVRRELIESQAKSIVKTHRAFRQTAWPKTLDQIRMDLFGP